MKIVLLLQNPAIRPAHSPPPAPRVALPERGDRGGSPPLPLPASPRPPSPSPLPPVGAAGRCPRGAPQSGGGGPPSSPVAGPRLGRAVLAAEPFGRRRSGADLDGGGAEALPLGGGDGPWLAAAGGARLAQI